MERSPSAAHTYRPVVGRAAPPQEQCRGQEPLRRVPPEQPALAELWAPLPPALAGRFAMPQPVPRPIPALMIRPHSAHLCHSAGARACHPWPLQTARARDCPGNRAKPWRPPKRIHQSYPPPRTPRREPSRACSRCQAIPCRQAPDPPPSALDLQAARPQKACVCVCVCRCPDRPDFNRPDVLACITASPRESLSAPRHRVICRPHLRGSQSFGAERSAHFAAASGLMRRLR